MKKMMLNKELIGEKLDLVDADSCFILTTQDERTVALNESAAYILKHCDNHSIEEITAMISDACDVDTLPDEFEEDILQFIGELSEQKLIIYVEG